MTAIFLSEDEVRSMTGRVIKSAQKLVLRHMGIEHRARPDGSLLVSRSHVEKVLGGNVEAKQEKNFTPNWDALNGAQKKSGKQRSA